MNYSELQKKNRELLKGATKKNKYNAKKITVDGITFDSQKEANRYFSLKNLERAGKISDLELQPKYVFEHNGVRITSYKADTQYIENGKLIVEDVKVDATITRDYSIRKKLMKAFYDIDVTEYI